MPVEDFIIYVYCCVDEALHEVVNPPPQKTRICPETQ